MKTSPSQFELMITFMEQHGDLSKPSGNAKGRMVAMKRWEHLTTMLNSDGSGDTKTSEKWKKVWSDYKNNTKKKAARLHKAAHGTGGGPAVYAKLSDLEQRVLKIIGVQVATGLLVEKAGLSQEIDVACTSQAPDYIILPQDELVEYPEEPAQNLAPLPSTSRAISSPPLAFEEVHILSTQTCDESGQTSMPQPFTEPEVSPLHVTANAQVESPSATGLLSPVHVDQAQPALSAPTPSRAGQTTPVPIGRTTPRRSIRTRVRGSPRRPPRRTTHTELAADQFLHAEEQWRDFKMKQHEDYMDLRREQNRVREIEVQAQLNGSIGWQAVATRALDLIEKVVNKYV